MAAGRFDPIQVHYSERPPGQPRGGNWHQPRDWAQQRQRIRHPQGEMRYGVNVQEGFAEAEQLQGGPLLSAEAMGVDEATYRLLMDLQFRDITPEDYEVLGELDKSVAPKKLDHKK